MFANDLLCRLVNDRRGELLKNNKPLARGVPPAGKVDITGVRR